MNEKKKVSLPNQSKKRLFAALMQLMSEKEYHTITISELSDKAQVDRRTFYRHFKSKEEVLDLIIVEAFQKHVANLRKLPQRENYDVCKAYFELLSHYVNFLLLLEKHNLLSIVQRRVAEYLPLLDQMFSEKPDCDHCSEHRRWQLTYKAGGVWGVTEKWIQDGAKESPEEMAHLLSAINYPIDD
ncbi:MAG: TetR/AcrR family transcriptional regulator [Coriobacteriia bacterium]|nr:TetR/AcrR family transcriptional regulator [Coriobacteriia bacterium]